MLINQSNLHNYFGDFFSAKAEEKYFETGQFVCKVRSSSVEEFMMNLTVKLFRWWERFDESRLMYKANDVDYLSGFLIQRSHKNVSIKFATLRLVSSFLSFDPLAESSR